MTHPNTTYKSGQIVEFKTAHGWEKVTILKWIKKLYGERDRLPTGYHPVRFHEDGARLMVHESGFRS